MIKKTECLQFSYENRVREKEFELDTQLQFSAQSPIDKTLLQRAIIVRFKAERDDQKFRLVCMCRVIFEFPSAEELLDGEALLRQHQMDAYHAVAEVINRTMTAMGQEKLEFPEV